MYMDPPSSREVPYNLTQSIPGGYEGIGDAYRVLKNKVGAFWRIGLPL